MAVGLLVAIDAFENANNPARGSTHTCGRQEEASLWRQLRALTGQVRLVKTFFAFASQFNKLRTLAPLKV
jgi:hypothetical protein